MFPPRSNWELRSSVY